jgi:hypothetical protein
MKSKIILWLSMSLNVTLAVAIFLLARSPATITPGPASGSQAQSPAPLATVAPAHETSTPQSGAVWPPFVWSQIAADDLKVYRDNLRAVGCPEATVRDVIMAEINERFGPRRQGILAGLQSRYWEILAHREFAAPRAPVHMEWARPLEDLNLERQKLIDEVLGRDYAATEVEFREQRESMQQQFAWLPGEKRDRLIALEELRRKRMQELAATYRPDSQTSAVDNERFEAVQREFETAQRELFTPEEYEEFQLRTAGAAQWAESLADFQPTETEWREVTKLQLEFESQQTRLANDEPGDQQRGVHEKELRDSLNAAIKEKLGAERFAQFELASNNEFQEARKITQRYGLPESAARETAEVQRAVVAQVQQLRDDPNISPDARQTALQAIQRETERTLAQTLGPKAFATYKQYSGAWLGELGQ